jgi:ABC-type sulfate transport system permease component
MTHHIRITSFVETPFADTPVGKHITATHVALLRAIAIVSLCMFGLSAMATLADTDRRIELAARV